jgi:hypothetical protein
MKYRDVPGSYSFVLAFVYTSSCGSITFSAFKCQIYVENKIYLAKVQLPLILIKPSRLGGVVVSVLAIGPKGREFKSCGGDGFLRTINIRSTPYIRWEVKQEASCRKILQHVKNHLQM